MDGTALPILPAFPWPADDSGSAASCMNGSTGR